MVRAAAVTTPAAPRSTSRREALKLLAGAASNTATP